MMDPAFRKLNGRECMERLAVVAVVIAMTATGISCGGVSGLHSSTKEPPAAAGDDGEIVDVRGRVLDEEGKPVSGVDISRWWTTNESGTKPTDPSRTDGDGRFSKRIEWYGRSYQFLAMDSERKRGAVFVYDHQASRKPAEIVLKPLARVRVSFESRSLGRKPEWVALVIHLKAIGGGFSVYFAKSGIFNFQLPPGEYEGEVRGDDVVVTTIDVAVPLGRIEVDLGTVDLKPAPLAFHWGKAPPAWSIKDARGIGKNVQPEDLKGKWLLLEFWAHW